MPELKEGKIVFSGRCFFCEFSATNEQSFSNYVEVNSGKNPCPSEADWERMIDDSREELQKKHFEKSEGKCNRRLTVVVIRS